MRPDTYCTGGWVGQENLSPTGFRTLDCRACSMLLCYAGCMRRAVQKVVGCAGMLHVMHASGTHVCHSGLFIKFLVLTLPFF